MTIIKKLKSIASISLNIIQYICYVHFFYIHYANNINFLNNSNIILPIFDDGISNFITTYISTILVFTCTLSMTK